MASDPPMHAESSSQRNDTGQGRSWGNINSGSSVRFQLGFPLGAGRGRDGAGRGRDGAGRGRGGAGRGGAGWCWPREPTRSPIRVVRGFGEFPGSDRTGQAPTPRVITGRVGVRPALSRTVCRTRGGRRRAWELVLVVWGFRLVVNLRAAAAGTSHRKPDPARGCFS